MGRIIRGPWSLKDSDADYLMNVSDEIEYVAFDLETTGLYKSDKIIEIALVVFKDGKILEEWSTLVNPMRDVGKTNIHGITPSMLSAAPLFEEITNDLFRVINNRVLVAHNFSFDARMLAQELEQHGKEGDIGKGFCTLIASRRILPGSGDSLKSTCDALGIPSISAHSALGDARMTMQIFHHLKEDDQKVTPAKMQYEKQKNPVPVIVRNAFSGEQDDALEQIRAFTSKVPFPTSDEKGVAYLLLLNMAMQDLIISKNEEADMRLLFRPK
ncbi:MAG: PolC-type DNA polymerase III [Actinomycetales bacterium]